MEPSTATVQEPVLKETAPAKAIPAVSAATERLMSIDALRGFDMFWIIGAEELVKGLKKLGDSGLLKIISDQLEHEAWEGVHFEDLIFPLFVFIVGVSIVFSLRKSIEQGGKTAAVLRVARRAVTLYLIGIFYYGGFANKWPGIRLVGVLQRIALCYFFASVIFLTCDLRKMIGVFVLLLAGYWALMSFVHLPGKEAISFAEKQNLSDYIDKMYLPGKRWDGDHDPEGLLSTIPAIGTCLFGVFAGLLLKNTTVDNRKKALWLIGGGLAAIALGYLWSFQFPIIKKIWTSSYVLVAGGYACILLGVFYQIIDVWKWRTWAMPFVWIGTNAITIYMFDNLFGFGKVANRLVGGDIAKWLGDSSTLVTALVSLGLSLLFLNFLYRKKLFLRL